MPDITIQYRYVNGALLLLMILALIAPFTLDMPNVNKYLSPIKVVPPSCFVKKYTGKDCPTCGLTRSIVALYNGNLNLSVKYHPVGYLFVSLLFIELLLRIIPIYYSHKLIPWLDMGQLIIVSILFRLTVYLTKM